MRLPCPEYEILEENEKELRVKMNLHINYELEKVILSNLGEVKVLSPQSLKDTIEDKIKAYLKSI